MTSLKSILISGLTILALSSCENNQKNLEEIATRSSSMTLNGNRLEGELKVENLVVGDESDYILLGNRKCKYVTLSGDNITLYFREFYDEHNKYEKNRAHSLVEVPLELAKTNNLPVKVVFEGCIIHQILPTGSYRMRDCKYFNFEPKLNSNP